MELNEAGVLVTGGSRGIGRETARLLGSRRARVAIRGQASDVNPYMGGVATPIWRSIR